MPPATIRLTLDDLAFEVDFDVDDRGTRLSEDPERLRTIAAIYTELVDGGEVAPTAWPADWTTPRTATASAVSASISCAQQEVQPHP